MKSILAFSAGWSWAFVALAKTDVTQCVAGAVGCIAMVAWICVDRRAYIEAQIKAGKA